MTPERRRKACAVIRAALSEVNVEFALTRSGHERQAISDAFAIGQASEVPSPLEPIPMRIACPDCGELHVDEGEFATKPHHTHSCQHCGLTWRPAVVATVGVRFLPGFRNEPKETP